LIAAAPQHDPPPHAILSLEIMQSKEPNVEEDSNNDSISGELYNIYEVLAAENTKHEARPPKFQEAGPPPSNLPAGNPPNTNSTQGPQYWYQSNAEDQKLTSQLYTWLLEGKLTQTTPAHVLAASAPIRKELADCLCP
jgi:hypothetical protein